MASTYTSNSGLELITTGEQAGFWGDTTNTNIQIIDRMTNGVGTITLSGTTHTLNTVDGSLSDGHYAVLVFAGSPSGTNTVTISPSDQQKTFFVKNTTDQTVVLTQGSGGNVTLSAGKSAIVYANGGGAGAAVVNVTDSSTLQFGLNSSSLIWVSVDGDDTNDGFQPYTPVRTLKHALSLVAQGGIVNVGPGTFSEVCPMVVPRDVSIIGAGLRVTQIEPTLATNTNSMFLVDSGAYLTSMTFAGHQAGAWAVRFNASADNTSIGAADAGAYIFKSPYIQNCTSYTAQDDSGVAGSTSDGTTGGGMLIDGDECASNSPIRSMVVDSYTQINLDGPGALVTNNAYAQLVSFFGTFCSYHVKATNGGQVNLSNSTTDFGTQGLVADGKSATAIYTGTASAQSAGENNFVVTALTPNTVGSSNRPAQGQVFVVGGNTYTITGAAPATGGYTVTFYPILSGALSGGETVSFYQRSQISTSGHTMEYVGAGTNYNALPFNGGEPIPANEIVELNGGRVFYSTTDQLGNFRVGTQFSVNGTTGEVTINTDSFNISGLNAIGPFSRDGGQTTVGVQLLEVSNNTDLNASTGVADGNTAPTQYAVKTYLENNYTLTSSLATVATSGSYTDLINKPTLYDDAAVDTHLNTSTATSGQVLSWTGTDYDWITDEGGTVTSVAATVPTGFSISGSPITTSGTLAITYSAGYQGYTTTEASKLSGIEAGADVTDAGNVNPLVDSHLNTSTATAGQVLSWTGTDYDWITDEGGTVTSVAATVPTGFSVSGSPITASGTLAITYSAGYQGYTTAEASKLSGIEAGADVTDAANVDPLVDAHLNTSTATGGQILSWTGTDYDWIAAASGYNDAAVDAHLNTSTATTGEVLSWTGADYDWITVGGGGISFTRHTTTYTASANEGIIADTSGGVWTLTLPATPSAGDVVAVVDGADWSVNHLTVARNGSTIEGDAEDMTMDVGRVSVDFIYDGTTWQIYAQVGGYSSGTAGGGGISFTRHTTTYTASANEGIIADTSGGVWTLTLPATPSAGDVVAVVDGADWGTNNLTVARNGSTIEGDAEDMTMDIGGVSVDFVYDGTTWHIYTQVGVASGAVVTEDGTQTLTNKTLTDPVLIGAPVEDVYLLTGTDIDPTNGTMQRKTTTSAETLTGANFTPGQSVTLTLSAAASVTFTGFTWVSSDGAAPTILSLNDTFVLWMDQGSNKYVAYLGGTV